VKIAFLGSHGTGKTTLCFEVAAHLKKLDYNVEMVKEVARSSPLPLNRETTLDAQRWILHTQIAREIAASAIHDAVICDRAVLDNYAYLVHRAGRLPTLDALVRDWMKTYDFLFKVPVTRVPRFDGVRDTSPAYQREIDSIVDQLLAEMQIPVHALAPKGRQRWLREILRAMSLPLEPAQISLFDDEDEATPADA
jgi:thymidylate kinase